MMHVAAIAVVALLFAGCFVTVAAACKSERQLVDMMIELCFQPVCRPATATMVPLVGYTSGFL